MSDVKITNNTADSLYEVSVDGESVGYVAYRQSEGRISFTSTHVQPKFQNQGLAAQLATTALDDARANNLRVDPQCSYFVIFIKRHPEYADLVI